MLASAARLFSNEQLVNPAWEPLSMKGLRFGPGASGRAKPRRLPAPDEAIALFALSLVLLFYVTPEWRHSGMIPTVLGNELLLILAPTLLVAWLARWQWRETFNWRAASPFLLAGAAIFAVGLSPWAQFAYALQNSVWPLDPNQQQAEQELFVTSLRAWPVLTILLAGALIVVGTTLIRHFTTDWLEVAKTQAMMRHFQRELMKARKENNTYRMKLLGDKQPEVMAQQQKLQGAQLKQMPLTMLVSIPIYAWLTTFLTALDNQAFAEPWNAAVSMNGRNGILPGLGSLFPHWILLSMALTIPLGLLVQRVMKYFAWRERWQKRHPEVHEGQ